MFLNTFVIPEFVTRYMQQVRKHTDAAGPESFFGESCFLTFNLALFSQRYLMCLQRLYPKGCL